MPKTRNIVEFGDFQTPLELASQAVGLLGDDDNPPRTIVEPTCGKGNFLATAIRFFPSVHRVLGFEINPVYAEEAKFMLRSDPRVEIREADFFRTDWNATFDGLPEPILVVGNPPWVTNAALGALGSANRPERKNFLGFSGFEALTGKSNFDISEWILIHLAEAMSRKTGQVAMLVKTAVARKLCLYVWSRNLPVKRLVLFQISAMKSFGASVDACFFLMDFGLSCCSREAEIYPSLSWDTTRQRIGFREGGVVADLDRYERTKHLSLKGKMKMWRSGIKHDCSSVFEFTRQGNLYRNGMDELVDLEPDYLFPLFKTSDVSRGFSREPRFVLVTQQSVKDDTSEIARKAPKTWSYLLNHAEMLDRRGSSIYKNRARFAVFGVGDYSFTPWKIAISALYKKLNFTVLPPIDGKPVMVDDATYFIPADTENEARKLGSILNGQESKDFFLSHIFWDAKRPITAGLLNRLDISRLRACPENERRARRY
jgi:hypothetical protein